MDKMYTVYDNKAKEYRIPMYLPHHAAAVRIFQQTLKNPETEVGKFPEDFDLYYLGEFDPVTGQHSNVTPEHVVSGKSFSGGKSE